MTDDSVRSDYRADIDRRLEAAVAPADAARTPMARTAVAADDRWYGEILRRTVDSVSDSVSVDRVLPAAAAMELLRGYCQLRRVQLGRITTRSVHPEVQNPTALLLAGDYLHSAAYTELGEAAHPDLGTCFHVLTNVSDTIVETFTACYARSPNVDRCRLIDGTAGAVGAGAAVIGATLADGDESAHDNFATLGRGLGATRRIHRMLDSGVDSIADGLPDADERRLFEHADHHLERAEDALGDLSTIVDETHLRPLLSGIDEF